ncbi:hypothetical protein DRJ48_03710 [Candidatus Woesearchaeota archaeon]|nr:hypothetical protein [Candidatus Woesearchaeota archaeon]RLE42342.1 MAG: hypothetical protein DRJ48_03710 [Candidatus Woesearchaeota archaeon]
MRNPILLVIIFMLSIAVADAATLTCQQITSSTIDLAQFSTTTIEIQCSASGGSVTNIQISPNPDPGTGLSIVNTKTMPSTLSDQESGTAKWSVTGETPNTYTISYTLISDGTESWSGADTTIVEVTAIAKLTVEYVHPPATYAEGETLDVKITNIGGTTANNIKLQLNSNPKVDYPTTIDAGSSASYSWTAETGFDQGGNYTTKVFIGDVLQDSATVEVESPETTTTTTTTTGGTTTTISGGGGGAGGGISAPPTTTAPTTVGEYRMTKTQHKFSLKKHDKVSFSVENENHTAELVKITKSDVTLEISSTPFNVTVRVGKATKVDVNNDNTLDLEIEVLSITNVSGEYVANMSFTLIEEELAPPSEEKEQPAEAPVVGEEVKEVEGEEQPVEAPEAPGEQEQPPARRSLLPIILVSIAVVAVLLIGLKIFIQHRRGY